MIRTDKWVSFLRKQGVDGLTNEPVEMAASVLTSKTMQDLMQRAVFKAALKGVVDAGEKVWTPISQEMQAAAPGGRAGALGLGGNVSLVVRDWRESGVSQLDRGGRVEGGLRRVAQGAEGLARAVNIVPLAASDIVGNIARGEGGRTGGAAQAFRGRVDEGLMGAIGPEGFGGSIIGAIPESVRNPLRETLEPLFNAMDWAYFNVVDQPLATAFMAGSVADDNGGVSALLKRDTYREARRIVNEYNLSVGSSFALMVGTEDVPTSEAEIQEVLDRDELHLLAVGLDVSASFFLDPIDKVAKYNRIYRASGSGIVDDVSRERFIARPSTQRKLVEMGDMTADQIRSRFFHKQGIAGDYAAEMLAAAPDKATRELVLRTATGDRAAKLRLMNDEPLLASMLDNGLETWRAEQNLIALADDGEEIARILEESRERAERLDVVVRDLYTDASPKFVADVVEFIEGGVAQGVRDRQLTKLNVLYGTVGDTRRFRSPATAVRNAVFTSKFYQRNRLAAPVRFVVEKVPHSLINLEDGSGTEQVRRILTRGQVDLDTSNDLVNKYAGALFAEERYEIAQQAMDTAIESILARKTVARRVGDAVFGADTNWTRKQIEGLMEELRDQRTRSRRMVANSTFFDNQKARTVTSEDGVITVLTQDRPMAVTETPNFMPTGDLFEFERWSTRWGRFVARHPNVELPKLVVKQVNRTFKQATLSTLRWPMRVISDEQARRLAEFKVVADTVGDVRSPWAVERLRDGALRAVSPSGRTIDIPAGLDDVFQQQVSARGLNNKFYLGKEAEAYADITGQSLKWGILDPATTKAVDYDGSWEKVANQHWGQDTVGNMILRGESDVTILDWLTNSQEGRLYVGRLDRFQRGERLRDWLAAWRDQMDEYLPHPDLWPAAARGEAKADDLRRLVSETDGLELPTIHGAIVESMPMHNQIMTTIGNARDKVMHWLGTVPTDKWSREPTFRAYFEAEVTRQVRMLPDELIDMREVDRIRRHAQQYALREMKTLMYDLAETSQFGEMISVISPFYNATEEVMTRWAGIGYRNPQAFTKVGIARRLIESQTQVDEATGDQYLVMRLPEWVKENAPWFDWTGDFRVNPELLPIMQDMVYNQGPSVGPIVGLPANEIVRHKPEWEESLEFIFPFGVAGESVGRNAWDMFVPGYVRNAILASAKNDPAGGDKEFMAQAMRLYRDRVTDFQLTDDDAFDWDPLTREARRTLWEDAMSDARKYFSLKTAVNFGIPFSMQFLSPYQVQIDAWREAYDLYLESPAAFRDAYPGFDEPDDWFIETHGQAFMALTESIRRNPEGLAPTIEAEKVRDRFGDLLDIYPEYGAAIAGVEDEGEFNRAVYESRFELRPLDETLEDAGEAFVVAPEVSLGWREYRAHRDVLDNELERRFNLGGSLSLGADQNDDLQQWNNAVMASLYETYPAWRRAKDQRDDGASRERNLAFRTLAQDDLLKERPDWQGVAGYFADRDLVMAELENRHAAGGASSLEKYPDLVAWWDTIVATRRLENPMFADFWARWLENDRLFVGDED